MSAKNKYTSEFKKTIVNLYHSGKSYAQIHNEYQTFSIGILKIVFYTFSGFETIIQYMLMKFKNLI